ncbi:XRE family transcriptional regulator [Streptomyces phaeolivaceus]|uniref:XRE family transcriptional regulator n=1 Tax=Streptomyces phaeolivaceus TaxID=2653200 RepID=A0A5P8KA61_9ACTN|nr:XRE family transcriptional regulator [Streptomyces phaeolivaceus]QFQ99900.1 XRE family transcriptional regulator [Streptomyces phaeolivaceus]
MPDELDPQVREFAGQLRRLVDRGGLSIAAVADRTGYSKTSWERYLNGRLLAPKGAIVALAEVTGTDPVHLTTMWELAERAWSRSEMRHDMTMEAIRISQARAALGETGGQSTVKGGGRTGRAGRSATATPGVAGPAGVSPTVPPQPRSSGDDRNSRPPYGGSITPATSSPATSSPSSSPSSPSSPSSASPYGGGAGAISGGAPRVSWGATPSTSSPSSPSASPQSPAPSSPSVSSASSSRVPAGTSVPGGAQAFGGGGQASGGAQASGGVSTPSGVFGPPPGGSGGGRSDDGDSRPKRRVTMFLAGAVGALVVIAAAFLLTDGDGKDQAQDRPSASPSTSIGKNRDLPAGVKCSGEDCEGKDPETMGCIGNLVRTTDEATIGTTRVEVRYSKTCQAAWARITGAAQGDEVQVAVGTKKQTAAIEAAGDNIAYTQMISVKDAGEATACATLASGQKGCTG